jgi:site-specific recombinase XerD
MLERYFPRDRDLARCLKQNPYAPDLQALLENLEAAGHQANTVMAYAKSGVHVVRCLSRGLIDLGGLSPVDVRRFARRHALHCRCPRPRPLGNNFGSVAVHFQRVFQERRGLRSSTAPKLSPSPTDELLEELDGFLHEVRGLRELTRERIQRELRRVLVPRFRDGAVDFSALSVEEIRGWVSERASRWSPSSTRALTGALHNLFRFLGVKGRPGAHLDSAVPTISSPRLSGVPKGLDEQQLQQVLAVIDTSKPIGLRTMAVVQCLGILGLRAGEVAALHLGDIDWRSGTLKLAKTKTRRTLMLPLPRSVGNAIAAYLKRGRPKTADRHVFVRHYFPVGGPLQSKDVGKTVKRALKRAGLHPPSMGAHVLRHTAASRLLRSGAKLKEVSDLLGHRDLDTTRIYMKVDWPRLSEVALPWPVEAV